MAKDPVLWRDAPELAEMAGPIISAHHPHLRGYPVRFAWRSIAKQKRGRPCALATAEIVSGRFFDFVATDEEKAQSANLGCPQRMFWIEVGEDLWEDLTEPQRVALLDHELCHCGVDYPEEKDGPELYMIDHSLEEFEDVVRRHGLWYPDVESMAAVMLGFENA